MNGTQRLWLATALVCFVVVVLLALTTVQRQPVRPTRAVRTAWLVGAMTSGTMLILIAAKVGDVIPNATVVDVGALAITGVLTGAFLALGLTPEPSDEVN